MGNDSCEASSTAASPAGGHVVVVEDDPFPRLLQVILDPGCDPERVQAFRHFLSLDLADFDGWLAQARAAAGPLYPSRVLLAGSDDALRAALPDATVLVVESFPIGAGELALAPNLRAVQKYGKVLRNIDTAACAARGIPVLGVRRRANIACAEHTMMLMLALAKRLPEVMGRISLRQLREAGFEPRTYDRRHTANSNWAGVGGLRILHGDTLGILGMGEIGRELAPRAAAFGMRVLYHQRTALPEAEASALPIEYAGLDRLLAESDWLSIQLPLGDSTRGFMDAARIGAMKKGAVLINTSRSELVDRGALLSALRSGHLGGLGLDTPYEEPARDDEELLGFRNVLVTPHTAAQPRFNALGDFMDLLGGLGKTLSK
jgi:phosphoglycerate dehydrogenase-like enzyme